jgi:hypothetical protein
MFNRPGVRGYRNLGILAAYVCLLVFFFRASWLSVVITWALFGLAGGITYTFWEILQRTKAKNEEKPEVGFTHFVPALALWPIMIPEAVEYALAELGILKAAKPKPEPNQPLQPTAPSGRQK